MTYIMWHKMQHIAALGSDEFEDGPSQIYGALSNSVFMAAVTFVYKEMK